VTDNANPLDGVIEDEAREAGRGRYGWLSLVVAAIFGLFFAYDVWEAISTMFALPEYYDAYGYGSENVPWWLLWTAVAIPIVAFLLAFVAGRRSDVLTKALIFVTGLAVSSALGMTLIALENVVRPVVLVITN
jgi:cyanate permease